MSAALLFASTAAGAAADQARALIAVPSGAEIWLQETLTDRVPGMGLVQRFRFVMPSIAELVPPMPEDALDANLPPADMLDEPVAGDVPLTEAEQAELDATLGGLVIEAVPRHEGVTPEGEMPGGVTVIPGLPGDGGVADAPLPSELAAPDATLPDGSLPDDTRPGAIAGAGAAGAGGAVDMGAPDGGGEAAGDLAAIAGADGVDGAALPAAPDILMQDPLHRDIVWLCENFALPQVVLENPRPTQVVISVASAESPFGSFDPAVVQLFEGFSIPRDRDACVWEPM